MAEHELEKTLWAAADILKIAGAYHTWRTPGGIFESATDEYAGRAVCGKRYIGTKHQGKTVIHWL
jgi:hypothetical protein